MPAMRGVRESICGAEEVTDALSDHSILRRSFLRSLAKMVKRLATYGELRTKTFAQTTIPQTADVSIPRGELFASMKKQTT